MGRLEVQEVTHNELLTKIEKQTVHIANKIKPVADSCEKDIGGFANALRAVVELHSHILYKNTETDEMYDQCHECSGNGYHALYPCNTIQTIEKELV